MTVGRNPINAAEVNNLVGDVLRRFIDLKEEIGHHKESLSSLDLKVPPYEMSTDDETLLKTAVLQLDTDLDAIDMTFINRLVGLF
jgi:hypothetical protein